MKCVKALIGVTLVVSSLIALGGCDEAIDEIENDFEKELAAAEAEF